MPSTLARISAPDLFEGVEKHPGTQIRYEIPPQSVHNDVFGVRISLPGGVLATPRCASFRQQYWGPRCGPSFSLRTTSPVYGVSNIHINLALTAFKLTDQEVVEFYDRNATNTIPGAPNLDLRYAVDGQRELTIHKPLPTASTGSKFELRNKVIGIYDKGSAGSAFDTEQTIVDSVTGEVYTTTRSVSFVPKQGNWGGPRGPKMPLYPAPNRTPDARYEVQTTDNTVFLYRLNGDYNPLHAVPGPGLKMGLGGVIIHGLFTYSSTCYGVVSKMCGGDASRLKSFGARFASPVKPGDTLTTTMWSMGMTGGLEEVRFITKNQESRIVLSNGRALLLPRIGLSNL